MVQFISGALSMGYLIAAFIFFKFYCQSRDRLFIFFSLSFGLLAVQRILFCVIESDSESNPEVLILRIIAYLLIISGIVDKNRKAMAARTGPVLPATDSGAG